MYALQKYSFLVTLTKESLPFTFFLAYLTWIVIFKFLSLSLITYFFVVLTSPNSVELKEISETLNLFEIPILGLASFLFVVFLDGFKTKYNAKNLTPSFTKERTNFFLGFLRGLFFATSFVLFCIFTNHYQYEGSFYYLFNTPLFFITFVFQIIGVGLLCYCEETLFRKKILLSFSNSISFLPKIIFCSVFFCLIKVIQFDLQFLQVLTLFLVSVLLSIKSFNNSTFDFNTGLLCGLIICWSTLFGLPVFNTDFSGILPITINHDIVSPSGIEDYYSFLSGGKHGPLSSNLLQLTMIILCFFCWKKRNSL